ncbi:hypothetical protein ATE47_12390 [Chryseobacterium sp. IHB B 17019]|nr:hypothetical protein ATE47_12390 [Chryseobacterium sp. IHB B 17019]
MFIDPDGKDIIFVHIINDKTQVQLQYRKGHFYYLNGDLAGKRYDGRNQSVSPNLFRLAKAYRKIEHSKNKELKAMLHILENSDNKHYIFDPSTPYEGSGMDGSPGGGSKTVYNLNSSSEKKRFKETEGVPSSDLTTVVHEMRHQFDKEVDNQSDATDEPGAENPAEQRAVKAENEARKIEGLPLRTTYGGQKVTPNPPNYVLPQEIIETDKKKN